MAGGYVPYSGIGKFYYPYWKRANLLPLGLIALLCSFSYFLGVWQHGDSRKAIESINLGTPCQTGKRFTTGASVTLDFDAHHGLEVLSSLTDQPRKYEACDVKYSEYTPCEDRDRSLEFKRDRLIYRERHCPAKHELLKCLIPAPFGYKNPFPWPASRDLAWYANVPHRELTVEKAGQNWIRVDGDKFRFPGGGTMFPNGADAYIDDIERLIPLRDGSIRTAIDTGCGVASWGAFLLSRNITAVSFAPRDTHEAQVQFALERGVPAMIGVMASKRLPYPSRAFDMAHCSRCLIPWQAYDGLLLMEVDRILRPGGYWILSGPPINWKRHSKGWQRTEEDLNAEQTAIEKVAKSLCWKKFKGSGDIAIWQKPTNHIHCQRSRKVIKSPLLCFRGDPDAAWYQDMEACITPLPEVENIQEIAGGQLAKWPERLTAVPPRISSRSVEGITAGDFIEDTQLWRRRVSRYKSLIGPLAQKGRYRNLLDMNARLGGFAAALIDDPLWVMNVVPMQAKPNTLGVIYERGLIGTYQDWCEAMSTYPRTYDLLHADSLFILYDGRCEMEDILLEMDRILRPEGTVIIRDDVDVVVKIKSITDGMRWQSQIVDHEQGPLERQKLLIAVKEYWTGPKDASDKLPE
ncbi:probable methyltransferase PMT16 [Aristolochia californica]|uniref:probable methyltransferase PMT16 n=1 Tax=Aristolochia californica TaxID=171875 RepID=UPI0035DC2C8A